jgi:ADP-ribose pyrophosphatase YjhB (NUDIX family)
LLKFATDILIFGIDSRKNENTRELPKKHLSILLIKRDKEPYKNMWCLPGGYVYEDENSFDAALRVLKKETNITDTYVEQLGVFDDVERDPRGRIISTAYLSLIDKCKIENCLSDNAKWFDIEIDDMDDVINIKLVDEIDLFICIKKILINEKANQYKYELISSSLAFDHGLIISNGIMKVRNQAENSDIIFNLMPDEFTIGELKQVYEIILGRNLINSAFRRVIAKKVKEVDKIIQTGGHRPSQKYKYIGDK